jgi:hypothetical protein
METPWTKDAKPAWLAHVAITADEWVGELLVTYPHKPELLALARQRRQQALDELVARGLIESYSLDLPVPAIH